MKMPLLSLRDLTLGAIVILGVLLSATCRAGLYEQIDAVADQYMADEEIPGMVIGVWRQGAEIAVLEKGVSNLQTSEAMSQLDAFRIASITKTFTVTRLLQLTGEPGATIHLDDPIGNYVGGLTNGNSITLRQLANMRSGIFNYTEDGAFITDVLNNPAKIWMDNELVALANTNAGNPYFPPGTNWHYSNTGTVLLGMVVEQAGGASLKAQIDANILAPLGMTHTVYPTDIAMPDPYSHGYADFFGTGLQDYTGVSPTGSSGSGAMISTLDDLRIWSKNLALGTLLTPEMQAERLDLISTAGGVGPFYDSYGLGIGSIDGWLGHTGDYIGYQGLMMYDPLMDQTVVILLNKSYAENLPTDIFQSLVPILVPEPSTWGLVLLGAVGLLLLRRKSFFVGS